MDPRARARREPLGRRAPREPRLQGDRRARARAPPRAAPASRPRTSPTRSAAARRRWATATSAAAATSARRSPSRPAASTPPARDVKAFCAGPIHALVVAASLVCSGVYEHVAVVAGGSLAKLGMKFAGALRNDVPVLEDVLAGLAILVGPAGRRRARRSASTPSAGTASAPARRSRPCSRTSSSSRWSVSAAGSSMSSATRPSCTTPRSPSRRAPATFRSGTTSSSARSRSSAASSSATKLDDFERERGLPGLLADAGPRRLGGAVAPARARGARAPARSARRCSSPRGRSSSAA